MPILAPSADLSEDLGGYNAGDGALQRRYKRIFTQGLNDGTRDLPLADVAEQADVENVQAEVDALQTDVTGLQGNVGTLQTNVGTLQTNVTGLQSEIASISSVHSSLTLYIRTTGNDGNDGLSEATALRTPEGATALINSRYAGFIKTLILNFGMESFTTTNWNPFAIDATCNHMAIVGNGASMNPTFFQSYVPWTMANNNHRLCRSLSLSGFHFRRMWDGSNASIILRNVQLFLPSGIRIYNSGTPAVGLEIGVGCGEVYWDGGNFFQGPFSNVVSGGDATITIAAAGSFQFLSSNTSMSYVFNISGGCMFIRSSSIDYGSAVATGFANISYGARIHFLNAAIQNAWQNGWNSSVSANSFMGLP